jgi:hypothetical protein
MIEGAASERLPGGELSSERRIPKSESERQLISAIKQWSALNSATGRKTENQKAREKKLLSAV